MATFTLPLPDSCFASNSTLCVESEIQLGDLAVPEVGESRKRWLTYLNSHESWTKGFGVTRKMRAPGQRIHVVSGFKFAIHPTIATMRIYTAVQPLIEFVIRSWSERLFVLGKPRE